MASLMLSRCRRICDLKSAIQLTSRPSFLPSQRARKGSKGYGIRYERSVATKSGGLHGQWFKFCDANGNGWCQTDVLLLLDGEVVVVECKLTDVDEAREQLRYLYLPVVSKALSRPARGIVCVRHLSKESNTSLVVTSMGQALKVASEGYYPTLHWIGRGPL